MRNDALINDHQSPSLDDLVVRPYLTQTLPPETRRALSWQCMVILAALQLDSNERDKPPGPTRDDGERLIGKVEVAELIGTSVSWVEKNARELPARRRVGRSPKWLRSEVIRWLQNRPEYA
jgi:predicted DNA-binding transcriptional regulator AlpA